MKYGQIAGSEKVNYAIYRCFEHLGDKDQQVFVKKFREQPHGSNQIMHTFRELILGAYLSSCGFKARHEYLVEGKTPDWCILDSRSAVAGIVELVNFRIDAVTNTEIDKQTQAKGIAVYRRDDNKNNVDRLYERIRDKMLKYKALTKKLRVPYVIGIFLDFKVAVDFEEIITCLHPNDIGLFQIYRHVSGILCFEENAGQYYFKYERNPNSLRKVELPDGILSLVPEQGV